MNRVRGHFLLPESASRSGNGGGNALPDLDPVVVAHSKCRCMISSAISYLSITTKSVQSVARQVGNNCSVHVKICTEKDDALMELATPSSKVTSDVHIHASSVHARQVPHY